MKFDPKTPIAGYPATAVRAFLQKVCGARLGFSADLAGEKATLSGPELRRFLKQLVAEGLLEPWRLADGRKGWRTTIQGNALAMARAGAPMTRATAEDLMVQFMARVRYVNNASEFAYRIVEVIVFGSYVTDAPLLNDLDLVVRLAPKEADQARQTEREQRSRQAALDEGVSLSSPLDLLLWPAAHVQKALKQRSRRISLHDAVEFEQLREELDIQFRVVFQSSS